MIPEEIEMLQDLVISAVNEALRQVEGQDHRGDGQDHQRPEHPRSGDN